MKIIAIDIGGTSVKLGVVENDEVIENTSVRNTFKGNQDTLLDAIKPIVDSYVEKYSINKIGIGCPGDIDDGIVIFASNLGWHNFKLKEIFEKAYPGFEIKVDNDGRTAALAEIKYGYLKGISNGLFVTIGRGIGGSIISDNKIIRGVHNRGGNFGHMVIKSFGRRCNCGRRGCFETYCSALGLIQTVREVNAKEENIENQVDTNSLAGRKIAEYVKQKNPVALKGVAIWNRDLVEGLLNLCLIFDPQAIVIAGGITDSNLLDVEYLRQSLKNNGYGHLVLNLAKHKSQTGLIGASLLVSC